MSAPVVRTPIDLVDLRVWLRDQWRDGGMFDRALSVDVMHIASGQTSVYARFERTTLDHASLWYVSADMIDLLEAAIPGVPTAVRIDELNRPSHAGLVVFEKPIDGIESATGERTCRVDAITWGGASLPPAARADATDGLPCVSVSSYRRLVFEDGLRNDELNLALRTGAIEHAHRTLLHDTDELVEAINVTEQAGEIVDVERREGRPKAAKGAVGYNLTGETWAPLGRSDWPVDEPLGEWTLTPPPNVSAFYTPEMIASAHEDRRLLAAFWTLVSQSAITRTTSRPADRQTRRRSERAGVKAASDVVVVTLRRPEHAASSGDSDDEHRHYSHSFLVTGYWRHQPVGPGRAERRLTWVRPHIKGDGPFVAKQRVNAWVR